MIEFPDRKCSWKSQPIQSSFSKRWVDGTVTYIGSLRYNIRTILIEWWSLLLNHVHPVIVDRIRCIVTQNSGKTCSVLITSDPRSIGRQGIIWTWEVIASSQQTPPLHAVWLLKLLDWSADVLRLMKRTQQAGCRFNSLFGPLQIITYQEQQKHWTTEVSKRRQGSLQSLTMDLNYLHAQQEICCNVFVSLIWNWLH